LFRFVVRYVGQGAEGVFVRTRCLALKALWKRLYRLFQINSNLPLIALPTSAAIR
jgi:hypothetical protein